MDDAEKDRLKKIKEEGSRYQELKNLPAWKEIEADLIKDYQVQLNKLIYEEDALSRAMIQGIEYIFEKIGNKLERGEIARARLYKNKLEEKGEVYVE
jgi:hypothetical protein